MALPQIATPEYTCIVPSTGEEIKFRPFLVKEEKILLMALESDELKDTILSTKQIISNCVLTEGFDIESLATFDYEFLFLQLRARSVGEVIELKIRHSDSNSECNHSTDVTINIDDITFNGEMPERNIMITDEVGIRMKLVGIDAAADVDFSKTDSIFKFVASNVEYIFDKDEVYSDFTQNEIEEWIENLNQKQLETIMNWFQKLPKLTHTVKWTCPECKKKDSMTLEGLDAFFTSG
jgi:hypothetical protein